MPPTTVAHTRALDSMGFGYDATPAVCWQQTFDGRFPNTRISNADFARRKALSLTLTSSTTDDR